MLYRCWASVVDGGPTLVQHRVDVSCLLGGTEFTFLPESQHQQITPPPPHRPGEELVKKHSLYPITSCYTSPNKSYVTIWKVFQLSRRGLRLMIFGYYKRLQTHIYSRNSLLISINVTATCQWFFLLIASQIGFIVEADGPIFICADTHLWSGGQYVCKYVWRQADVYIHTFTYIYLCTSYVFNEQYNIYQIIISFFYSINESNLVVQIWF